MEHAVDAVAHKQTVFLRFDVDVGAVVVDGLVDEQADEACHRGGVLAAVGFEVHFLLGGRRDFVRQLGQLRVGAQVPVDGVLHLRRHRHHGNDRHAGAGGHVVDGGEVFRVGHGHGDASVDNGQWQQLVATAQVVRHHADDFFVYLVFVEVYERQTHALS